MSTIQPPENATPEYMEWVEFQTGRSLPVIITAPGEYRTRNGKRVLISSHDRNTTSSFPCEGEIVHKEKPLKTEWQIWKANGRITSIGESSHDIVARTT